jgi:hypothetical protein
MPRSTMTTELQLIRFLSTPRFTKAEWPESLVKRLQGVAEHMKRFRTAMQTHI